MITPVADYQVAFPFVAVRVRRTIAAVLLMGANASLGNPEFFAAVKDGGSDRAVEMLNAQPELAKVADESGQTALHYAARNGDTALIKALLSNDANVNALNVRKETPLHFAARKLHVDAVKMLLEHGASPTLENQSGSTPMFWAIRFGPDEAEAPNRRLQIVEMLAEAERAAPKEPDEKKRRQSTPLHVAAEYRRAHLLPVLAMPGTDLNAEDPYGRTPLHAAAIGGDVEVVAWLIAHGAKVKAADRQKETPLHMAVYRFRPDVAEAIAAAGAEVNAQNRSKRTPLHAAVTHGRRNRPMEAERDPKYQEIESARVTLVELLLKHGADTTILDDRSMTPLQHAKIAGSDQLVELLTKHDPPK